MNTPNWRHHWLSINIESSCHLRCMHQLYTRLSWLTCESSEAGRAAVQPGSRGHGCGMLSPGPERGAALPKPFQDPVCRPQPSAQSPKEEATRGAEGRRRREEERRGGGGEGGRRGPIQPCPTTHYGRKQSSVGSVSAQETSCGKVRERRREGLLKGGGDTVEEKGKSGNGEGKSDESTSG